MPDFTYETTFGALNGKYVCGTDEVGRGPLAGPCTAAAVILNPHNIPEGLNDSKKLSKRRREELFDEILRTAYVSVASVSAREIDNTNIRAASLKAMVLAISGLQIQPHHVLIDGNAIPSDLKIPATYIIKGDAKCLSISAASIVAKVIRDRAMDQADKVWPGYGFAKNAGYGSKQHLDGISRLGPCPIHRFTFEPIRELVEPKLTLV